ncbi:MAG: hypothetical protein DI606_15335 [Sphingobium sp.]|uniref:cytochrome C oxidase subunit IV family protein n=1 Tax=Sphingobium sp. TaxID=1912891 RepID=UPI000DB3A6BF|nr:cytochrome C oxidase subunit IV family protein [Sphingobium sp.]PZU08347.1 MAG: hypothetical protein DI606_15335 [Sphingobium sp.]
MGMMLRNRITLIWAILVVATFLSFETMTLGSASLLRSLILIIAFSKALLVGREFMELRHAPPMMLWMFQAWAVVTCLVLIVLFAY